MDQLLLSNVLKESPILLIIIILIISTYRLPKSILETQGLQYLIQELNQLNRAIFPKLILGKSNSNTNNNSITSINIITIILISKKSLYLLIIGVEAH